MLHEDVKYDILDSIPDLSSYKSVTDRYFSRRYIVNFAGIENNDIMLLFHSNRIILLTLAPSHSFFKKQGEYKLNFKVGQVDRLKNAVKGKGKKGGQHLSPNSIVCKVEFNDDTSYDISSGIEGNLIEVNDALIKRPQLLKEMPDSDGFIAIILSTIELTETLKNKLLTHEDYLKLLDEST